MAIYKYRATKKQKNFIEDNSNFLIVSAGPGTGKTETLIRYLIAKASTNEKAILACSFTKNSTNEIKNRFYRIYKKDNWEKLVVFKTFDSFLINNIWKFYSNRIVKHAIKKFEIKEMEKTSFGIEQSKIVYSKVKWKEFEDNYKNNLWIKSHIIEFINHFKEGILLSGFISEFLLYWFIRENKEVKKYLTRAFERIVVDEAQDLSILRYLILLELHTEANIKVTLVGDERQSLYEYLGAKKNSFKWIEKKYYRKLKIKKIALNWNFRYKNINSQENVNIKNALLTKEEKFFKKSISMAIDRNIIEVINNEKRLKDCVANGYSLFLTKLNRDVEKTSKYLKECNIKHRAILKMPGKVTKNFSFAEQNFIESLFLCQIIAKREISLNDIKISAFDEICDFLWPNDPKANEKFAKLFWDDKNKFILQLDKISKISGIKEIEKVLNLLKQNKNYILNFKQEKIQVMTFHSSKGLESRNVFINMSDLEMYLKNFYGSKFNCPTYEEMFVAFSRSKDKIFIYDLKKISNDSFRKKDLQKKKKHLKKSH